MEYSVPGLTEYLIRPFLALLSTKVQEYSFLIFRVLWKGLAKAVVAVDKSFQQQKQQI